MRLLVLAASLSFVVAAATVACSSAAPVTAAADAGRDSGKAAPTSGDDDDTVPVKETPPASDAGDAGDGGPTGTPGGPLTTAGDGGTACDVDSFREAEVNNTEATANPIVTKVGTTTICGVVTSADPDFFTFKLPAGATNFHLDPTGGENFKLSGTVGGKPFENYNFPDGISADDVWVIQISTGSATARNYQLAFDFN